MSEEFNPDPSSESPRSRYLSQDSVDSALRFRSSTYKKYVVGAVLDPSQQNPGLARDRGNSDDGSGFKKIIVAKVSSAFGIKGEVKLICFLEDPKKIEKYPLFDDAGNAIKIKITNKNKTVIGHTASGDPVMIAKIDGVNDRNASELWNGKEIFANRFDFSPTKKDEFYVSDLIGLDVIGMNSKKIGKVIDVTNYGAGTIIEIKFNQPDPEKNLEKIENFPFKNEFFPEVNLAKGFILFSEPNIVLPMGQV